MKEEKKEQKELEHEQPLGHMCRTVVIVGIVLMCNLCITFMCDFISLSYMC